jgi:hypothetical protein
VLAERVRLEFYGYPADYLETYKAALEKVTVADLNRGGKEVHSSRQAGHSGGGQRAGDQAGLDELKLGPVQTVDITIPMPSAASRCWRTSLPPPARLWRQPTSMSSSATRRKGARSGGRHRRRFVEQTEQRGTGHAIQCAREAIAGYENILVLSGDVPLIRPETIEQLWQFHQAQQAAMTILTAAPEDPTGYGRIRAPSRLNSRGRGHRRAEGADRRQQQGFARSTPASTPSKTAPLLAISASSPPTTPTRSLPDRYGRTAALGRRARGCHSGAEAAEVLGANTIAELVALDATLRLPRPTA